MKRANVNEIIMNMDDLILDLKVKEIMSDNPIHQMSAIRFFQMVLSVPAPDIEKVLLLNILPRVTELITKRSDNLFQLHACWALTNIATTSSNVGSEAILKVNGLEVLMAAFDKGNIEVKIQALWGLTNVFQDREESRNKVISMGILPRTIGLLPQVPSNNFDWIQIILWTLVNLIDLKFYPQLDNASMKKCLKVFLEHFHSSSDPVKIEALIGISAISESKNFNLDIIDAQIFPELIQLINGDKKIMRKEALRIIGNIAYTSASNLLVEYNVIDSLKNLLLVPDESILKEACWILSNICADLFIDQLFDANIFPRILELAIHKDRKVRREANWVIANTCKNGNFEQVKELVIMEVLKPLTQALDEKEDMEILTIVCESIFTILMKGDNLFWDVNLYSILVDKYGGEFIEL